MVADRRCWDPEGEMIYQWPMLDEPIKPNKYQVTKNGDNFDLRILNLDFKDGGLYHCQIVLAAEIAGADLVVLSECIIPVYHRVDIYPNALSNTCLLS